MTQQPRGTVPEPSTTLRLDSGAVALGSGLGATAVVLSSIHSRAKHDLDWSNFSMGLLATLGLLAVAIVAHLIVEHPELRANLTSWPGAFGAVSAGFMIPLAMDYNSLSWYLAGIAVVALGVGGYLLVRSGAFVLATIAGLLVLYVQLFDDTVGVDDGDNFGMWASVAILVFAGVATLAGWYLPSRDLSGVVVGAAAVGAHLALLYGLLIIGSFQVFDESFDEGSYDGGPPPRFDGYDNDVLVILLVSLALCALWAWCNWQTGHPGYRVLIVANLVTVTPLATTVLAVEHPTYWELAVGLAGAAVLASALVRALGGAASLRGLKTPGAG
jgi:hypothetical protein